MLVSVEKNHGVMGIPEEILRKLNRSYEYAINCFIVKLIVISIISIHYIYQFENVLMK